MLHERVIAFKHDPSPAEWGQGAPKNPALQPTAAVVSEGEQEFCCRPCDVSLLSRSRRGHR